MTLALRAFTGSLLAICGMFATNGLAQGAQPTRITPFVLVEKKSSGGQKIPANTYTRLQIVSTAGGGELINYEKRDLLFRIGVGKKYSFSSVLRARVGFFKDTIPLVSREYESSAKVGETFSRSIGYDNLDFPYFLSSGDTTGRTGRFTVTASMVESTSSKVSSLALTFVRDALKAVAPSSGLLTTLTKESSEAVANTLDQQASMLFGTSVGEGISFDLPLGEETSYDVTVFGPNKELDELMANGAQIIGKWTVSFAPARPSAFSSVTCVGGAAVTCDWQAAYNEAVAQPANVLAFKLVNRVDDLGTISAFLLHQEWWTRDMLALEATSLADGALFAQFCRKVRGSVSELGFNDLDGRVVAAAVARSGLVSGRVKDGLDMQADCKYVQ